MRNRITPVWRCCGCACWPRSIRRSRNCCRRPSWTSPKLRRFAEDEIEARFERVPGVSQSNVIGGLEDELQVVVDPEKLAARQLTIADVRNVLRGQNEDTSAGDYWEGKRRWVVRTLGQFRTPEQVENQLLAVRDGTRFMSATWPKCGSATRSPTDWSAVSANPASPSMSARNRRKRAGRDGRTAKRSTIELNDGLLKQRGLQLTQVYDETEYIDSSINLVQQNIFIGGALTMIVLMLFLHLGLRTLIFAPLILVSAMAVPPTFRPGSSPLRWRSSWAPVFGLRAVPWSWAWRFPPASSARFSSWACWDDR